MNTKPLLVLSVVGNCILLGIVGYMAKQPAKAPVVEHASSETASMKPSESVKERKTIVTVTNQVPAQKFGWQAVESEDYKQYIANLRSIGCPEETIRDIIIADVNKLFESRKKALSAGKKFEFWKSGNMFAGMMDPELAKKKQELAEEKRALLKELLGIEPEDSADLAALTNPLTTMLDFLPEEKQSKVSKILQEFQGKAMKSMQGGAPDAEDLKGIMKVQKEMEAELAKVLSPEELEDYQLRLSQTSMMMRMQLGTFDPSEQEFRDIFKMRKAFDDEYGWNGMGAASKEDREKMKTAQTELNDKIKELLGESRYTQYQRAQDFQYQGLVKVVERNGLGRDVADKVYDIKKVSNDEISKLRGNKDLSSEKRDEAIRAIREETQRSIRELMGDKAYEAYTNRPGSGF